MNWRLLATDIGIVLSAPVWFPLLIVFMLVYKSLAAFADRYYPDLAKKLKDWP